MPLETEKWGEFSLYALFGDCERGTRITTHDRIDGKIPFCTAGEYNEGISGFISNTEAKTYSKKLTIDMFGNCYYHGYPFKCDDNILVFGNENVETEIGLFLASVISKDKYKYNYGRQYRQEDYYSHLISLPITEDGAPDWEWMKNYIKSLPYSDRVAS